MAIPITMYCHTSATQQIPMAGPEIAGCFSLAHAIGPRIKPTSEHDTAVIVNHFSR